jgi:hypothetical protein
VGPILLIPSFFCFYFVAQIIFSYAVVQANFLQAAVDYKKKIGFKGMLYDLPVPISQTQALHIFFFQHDNLVIELRFCYFRNIVDRA